MEMKKRIEWIDSIRGLAILGVIMFHTGFLPFITITDPLLMSWILPVFVFTGGWLLKDAPLTRQRLFSTARRLLIPFCTAGVVSFVGWLILRNIYPRGVLLQPIGQELVKWLTGRNPYFNSPLWFIPAYFFASLVIQAMAPAWFRMEKNIQILFAISTVTAGLMLTTPFRYPVYSYDIVFLFIGMMMTGSIASTIRVPETKYRTLIDILFLMFFVSISISNGYIDVFQRQFGNPVLFVLSALSGTYSIARLVKSVRILCSVGRNSMILMVWHWPVLQWLTYGLFTTGILKDIASHYSKTSFVLGTVWGQIFILQILLCLIYVGITVYGILTIKKFLYRCWDEIRISSRFTLAKK